MLQVAVIGNGNWGTAVAKLVAQNLSKYPELSNKLYLWVYEEYYEGKPLSEHINQSHLNPKYLPGIELPSNIEATTSFEMTDVDIFIFCLPHQFIETLRKIKRKKDAFGINLSKGLILKDNKLYSPSEYFSSMLNMPCSCLMGGTIANQVAEDVLSECTLGVSDGTDELIQVKLFESNCFKVSAKRYTRSLEICGSVKNVISLAYGMADGLGCKSNTLAMLFRRGLREMQMFCDEIKAPLDITDAACLGDLYVSCHSGRNYKCGIEMAKSRISCKAYEEEVLNGQKLQGPGASDAIVSWLSANMKEEIGRKYPIIYSVHRICSGREEVESLLDALSA